MKGIELIAKERQRQFSEEGFVNEHDDQYTHNELQRAAICYLMDEDDRQAVNEDGEDIFDCFWPWHYSWFKPTPDDRVRELVKAGALIAAEIDRLLRQELKQPEP